MSKTYRGTHIEVHFDRDRCIHAARCVRGLPRVFDVKKRPWIEADGADAEHVAAVVRTCPSGALTYTLIGEGADEAVPEHNVVRLTENGPLEVRGDVRVADAVMTRLTLCRCGASKRKPFCDGSHGTVGFVASGEIPRVQAIDPTDEPGALEVIPLTDGPLLLKGPMQIVGESGEPIQRAGKAALCRCGASGDKPFCDGSHRRVGFKGT